MSTLKNITACAVHRLQESRLWAEVTAHLGRTLQRKRLSPCQLQLTLQDPILLPGNRRLGSGSVQLCEQLLCSVLGDHQGARVLQYPRLGSA